MAYLHKKGNTFSGKESLADGTGYIMMSVGNGKVLIWGGREYQQFPDSGG